MTLLIEPTGVHRPTYSPEDMESRRWLMARMEECGLEPAIDGIGTGRAADDVVPDRADHRPSAGMVAVPTSVTGTLAPHDA